MGFKPGCDGHRPAWPVVVMELLECWSVGVLDGPFK
jgi:hypothetical protein